MKNKKSDFEKNFDPINYPDQDKRAGVFALIGLIFAFLLVLGALMALINEATGGAGILGI